MDVMRQLMRAMERQIGVAAQTVAREDRAVLMLAAREFTQAGERLLCTLQRVAR